MNRLDHFLDQHASRIQLLLIVAITFTIGFAAGTFEPTTLAQETSAPAVG